MGRLHGLHHHTHQVVVEGFQVRLVPELGREGFQGLSRVVPAAVEAPIYEGLDAFSQRREQGRYDQGGRDDGQLRLVPGDGAEAYCNETTPPT
jgi:hypothetical protein